MYIIICLQHNVKIRRLLIYIPMYTHYIVENISPQIINNFLSNSGIFLYYNYCKLLTITK